MKGRFFTLISLLCLLAAPVLGASSDDVIVVTDEQTRLRALALDYLHDPDAWPEILRANDLISADQIKPGLRLRIPVSAVRDFSASLAKLRELIYRGTAMGAQVLATEAINAAIAKESEAVQAQRKGRLAEASASLTAGIASAETALESCRASRDAAAQAILDLTRGTVQRRRPDEFDWTSIPAKTLLAELERIRTLSRSFALVRFRDASSLQLYENAQLAIRRLRRDELTSSEQVDAVLYSGDIRALIKSGGGRESITVNTPGVETGIRSNHYWLQKEGQTTRIANYDGEIQVSAGGGSVVVRENQGTSVGANSRPETPGNLLPAPPLAAPVEGQRVFGADVDLDWEPVANAAAYWLEVARDRQFARLALTETGLKDNRYSVTLDPGVYYWRVSSVDGAGLPGPCSRGKSFQILQDHVAPYVAVTAPAQDAVLSEPRVTLQGRLEAGAQLVVGGRVVEPDKGGAFTFDEELREGPNRLVLEARDAAGNLSRLEWRLHYHPRTGLPLQVVEGFPRDQKGVLLANHTPFVLDGTTLPQAKITVEGAAAAASAIADDEGRFQLTLQARPEPMTLTLKADGTLGQTATLPVRVRLDADPPRILLNPEPSERTAKSSLTLTGRLEDGVSLEQGGKPIPVASDGRFSVQIDLVSGENLVQLEARDAAGNRAEWQRRIRLDAEPPVLDASLVTEQRSQAGRQVLVEIQAHDESGLTAGVPYQIDVGDRVVTGIASRCPDRACFRDRVHLPANARGRPKLRTVTLQDYLGNRQEMHLE